MKNCIECMTEMNTMFNNCNLLKDWCEKNGKPIETLCGSSSSTEKEKQKIQNTRKR